MKPLSTVALVCHSTDVGPGDFTVTKQPTVLGTCFAFRYPTTFLTARHVFRRANPQELAISFLTIPGLRPVVEVHAHPSADLAVLKTADVNTAGIEPFWDVVSNLSIGEEFFAYGFPEDLLFGSGGTPARLFTGHYQRFFDFDSPHNYRYVAGEMSIPCPAGLSGGPLFRPGAAVMLTAMAAENLETSLWKEVEETEGPDGRPVRKIAGEGRVNYGIAVILAEILDWLNERVPPRSPDSFLRPPIPTR